jgi:hypothetical protein
MDEAFETRIDEWIRNLSPAYAILRKIEDPAVAREIGLLIDHLRQEQISFTVEIDEGMASILALPGEDRAAAARCWRKFVKAAHPDRRATEAALRGFAPCLTRVEAALREPLFEGLPALGPAAGVLAGEPLETLVDALNHSGPGNAWLAIGFAGAFANTSPDIARSAARIAATCAKTHREHLLESLLAVFPPEHVFDTREHEKLLPAMAPLPASALAVLLAVIPVNVSSAVDTARRLPAVLARHGNVEAYLEAFREIVACLGIRALGFCLSKLPALDADRTAAVARETSARAGILAAEHLLRRL